MSSFEADVDELDYEAPTLDDAAPTLFDDDMAKRKLRSFYQENSENIGFLRHDHPLFSDERLLPALAFLALQCPGPKVVPSITNPTAEITTFHAQLRELTGIRSKEEGNSNTNYEIAASMLSNYAMYKPNIRNSLAKGPLRMLTPDAFEKFCNELTASHMETASASTFASDARQILALLRRLRLSSLLFEMLGYRNLTVDDPVISNLQRTTIKSFPFTDSERLEFDDDAGKAGAAGAECFQREVTRILALTLEWRRIREACSEDKRQKDDAKAKADELAKSNAVASQKKQLADYCIATAAQGVAALIIESNPTTSPGDDKISAVINALTRGDVESWSNDLPDLEAIAPIHLCAKLAGTNTSIIRNAVCVALKKQQRQMPGFEPAAEASI